MTKEKAFDELAKAAEGFVELDGGLTEEEAEANLAAAALDYARSCGWAPVGGGATGPRDVSRG